MKRSRLMLTLWTCRITPVLLLAIMIILGVLDYLGHPLDARNHFLAFLTILAILLSLYFVLIWIVIPNLLANGQKRSITKFMTDFIIAGATAGLYMVILYWMKADAPLRQRIDQCKTSGPEEKSG